MGELDPAPFSFFRIGRDFAERILIGRPPVRTELHDLDSAQVRPTLLFVANCAIQSDFLVGAPVVMIFYF
jgi:hypothetical protein